MTEKFKNQKHLLSLALTYANKIEYCDKKIEAGRHVNYFKWERNQAIEQYADAVALIIESSIDIAEQNSKFISDNLFETIGTITKQYAIQNGINLK